MENFEALQRDTQPHNNPTGTWQFARNIVKRGGSIKNENGFEQISTTNGVEIGLIVTNKESVCFNIGSTYDEIGIKRKVNGSWVYTPVLRGVLGFNINCPIEGIFIYNYKEELIVLYSDGIKSNSSVPKLLNLTKLPFEVDANYFPVNPDDLNKIKLFPNVTQGRTEVENITGGNIQGNVAYYTFCYVFDDNSSSLWFPLSDIVYTAIGYNPTSRRGFNLKFYDLDSQFNKIKIGLVIKEDGQLKAYESYSIEYTKNSNPLEYDLFQSITSISNYNSIGVEELVVAKDIFEKVRTITKQNNEVLVGNTRKRDYENLQKYFNALELLPVITQSINREDKYLDAAFSPDEVYSIWCEVQWLDGSYSDAYHIPGRADIWDEDIPLSPTVKTDYRLQDAPADARRFHYLNSGTMDSNLVGTFGFWRNDERYPNKEEYDGSIVGNEDLRGEYIRYHRFPGYDTLHLEATNRNFLPQRVNEESELDDDTNMLKFGIRVVNFNTLFPSNIQNQIQGYRLSFIKRTFADSLVVGHSLLFSASRLDLKNSEPLGNPISIDTIHPASVNFLGDVPQYGTYGSLVECNGFTYGALISPEIYKNKPKTTITHAKANYIVGIVENWKTILGFHVTDIKKVKDLTIPSEDKFAIVDEQIKYLPSNNFASYTAFQEESNRIRFKRPNWHFFPDSYDNHNFLVPLVTLFGLKYNLYSGFRSTDLIVIGRTNKINKPNVDMFGGDVFNSSSINMSIYSTANATIDLAESGIVISEQLRLRFKGIPESINEQQLYNLETSYSEELNGQLKISWNDFPDRDYTITFKGEEDLSSFNNISTIQSWNININFISRFPYRVNRGNKIPSENITTNSLRSFLVSNYYDMPNDKGEIVALRGNNRTLYIQQEFALFSAFVKDVIKGQNSEDVYLGRGDIFDREPTEIIPDSVGYIGSTSQFACIMTKIGLITIDSLKGKIFVIGEGVNEITSKGMRDYFYKNSNIGLDLYVLKEDGVTKVSPDNPYASVGYIASFDEEFNRLIITKRKYKPLVTLSDAITDGEFYYLNGNQLVDFNNSVYFKNLSTTFSYSLSNNSGWVCEHDYFTNMLYYNNEGIFAVENNLNNMSSITYKLNNPLLKGEYGNKKFPSYIDLIFNTENQISKIYKSLQWISEGIDIQGKQLRNKTITGIAVYNYDQCTGEIDLTNKQFELIRESQYSWKFNKIRDMVVNKDLPIILDNGEINYNNINYNKPFFDKRNFISKFVVVRLIIDNRDNNDVFIHSVNINSLKIG